MSCIQFWVAGVIAMGCALLFEKVVWRDLLNAKWPLLYAGVMSCGVAYTLQIVGQKSVHPVVASLLMSLESVFAALSGWVILHEKLSGTELLGCAIIFIAVIIAQLPAKDKE
jgi:drug/metabolite transporter (DMT)-like permease